MKVNQSMKPRSEEHNWIAVESRAVKQAGTERGIVAILLLWKPFSNCVSSAFCEQSNV